MVVRQVARMWLSHKGSVSPLHYDGHTSFLTQVCRNLSVLVPAAQDSFSNARLPVICCLELDAMEVADCFQHFD